MMASGLLGSDEVALVWVGLIAGWTILFGLMGLAVGKGKGRGGLGFALGFLLGIIGVIIIAVLSPTPESERRRYALITGNDPFRPLAPAGPTDDEIRQQAVAEVVRRDPSLAAASDPDSLRALAAATAGVVEELRVKAALEAVQRQQKQEAAAAKVAAKSRRDRDEAERERLAASERAAHEAAVRREERAQRIAGLPPARRWVAQHRALTIGMAVLLIAAIAAPITVVSVGSARNRAAAEQLAAEQAAEQQAQAEAAELVRAASASCDPSQFNSPTTGEPKVLTAWAQCADPTARRFAAGIATTPDEVVRLLAVDRDPTVRAAVAARTGLPDDLMLSLAGDSDPAVGLALAQRNDLDEAAALALATDSDLSVMSAMVDKATSSTSEEIWRALARTANLNDTLRMKMWGSDVLPQTIASTLVPMCVTDLEEPRQSLAGTSWRYVTDSEVDVIDGGVYEYYLNPNCFVDHYSSVSAQKRFAGSEDNSIWQQRGDVVYMSINYGYTNETYELRKGRLVGDGRVLARIPRIS